MPTAPLVERTSFLWLDSTRKCQLCCIHCYNASGPDGTHGAMAGEDWINVLDQAVAAGVDHVQFIGGEPTMHPDFAALVDHGIAVGLDIEVFSNLVHVTDDHWELFQRNGVSLATSYYSGHDTEHNAVTGRPSHARTRSNTAKAVQLRIPIRVGIIGSDDGGIERTRQDLQTLGVTKIGVDHVRPFGRGAQKQEEPDPANLCGQCGTGQAAIGPDGTVSPCVFSTWLGVGSVQETPLDAILSGPAMGTARGTIRKALGWGKCDPKKAPCYPDRAPCGPDRNPRTPCNPEEEAECSPGGPPSTCRPRR